MSLIQQTRPTPKMLNYLLLLFNECDFTINSRNVWLSERYKRKINHLDELAQSEAHAVIERLKDIREGQKK